MTIYFSADKKGPREDVVIYLPAGASKPVPLLLCLNFSPNASIYDDPRSEAWGDVEPERKQSPSPARQRSGRMNIDG